MYVFTIAHLQPASTNKKEHSNMIGHNLVTHYMMMVQIHIFFNLIFAPFIILLALSLLIYGLHLKDTQLYICNVIQNFELVC